MYVMSRIERLFGCVPRHLKRKEKTKGGGTAYCNAEGEEEFNGKLF